MSAKPRKWTDQDVDLDELIQQQWYYTLELTPGKFTNGLGTRNFSLTRQALRSTDVKGCDCLDIGTMEGVVPVLLKRGGALSVTAYDRYDLSERVDLVKQAYDSEWGYHAGFALHELPNRLKDQGRNLFDVAVFSGVLYHMFNPLSGLAITRGMVRNGGIAVIETACVLEDTVALHFNEEGRYFPRTNFFMPSVRGLDAMLRFLRFEPLDLAYSKTKLKDRVDKKAIVRVCVPCRAVDHPVTGDTDRWSGQNFSIDFLEHGIDLDALATGQADVPYSPSGLETVRHAHADAIDLYQTLLISPEAEDVLKLSRLHLDDMW